MQSGFEKLNDYFDKIYILSLPSLPERIEYINRVCVGLDFEFFWGVDKKNSSIEDLKNQNLYSEERYNSLYRKRENINLGMLCCSLGHLNIYQEIVRKGYQRTLILEDDVIPVFENLKKFETIIEELPVNWELLYLGYEKNDIYGWKALLKKFLYKFSPPYTDIKLNKKIFSNYYPTPVNDNIAIAGFHDCTHAYGVTIAGAKKIIEMQTPVAFNPDNLLAYMISSKLLDGYICRNRLFNQLTAFKDAASSLTSS